VVLLPLLASHCTTCRCCLSFLEEGKDKGKPKC